jgi:hypothetical protein
MKLLVTILVCLAMLAPSIAAGGVSSASATVTLPAQAIVQAAPSACTPAPAVCTPADHATGLLLPPAKATAEVLSAPLFENAPRIQGRSRTRAVAVSRNRAILGGRARAVAVSRTGRGQP